ncbi:MAG: hypothetical protein QW461_09055 [Candidatus Jordarchaeales archaeon]
MLNKGFPEGERVLALREWSYHQPIKGKANIDAYLSTHYAMIDYLIEKDGNITAAIKDGWELGRKAGTRFFVRFSDKIKKYGRNLEGVAKVLNEIYESITGKKFDEIEVGEKTIVFEDYKCPLCEDYVFPDEFKKEGRACIAISGVFTEVCNLAGLKVKCWETKCKAAGDDCCRHELEITK